MNCAKINSHAIVVSLYLMCLLLVEFSSSISTAVISGPRKKGVPIHKVQLTQRDYIQFLRWELAVPEIKEFTFCLWVQSTNLTLPHSIFSYSKDEKDRLVRAWISPHGRSVNLEIGEQRVFEANTEILENRWYHICQSWESKDGKYAVWIDGRLAGQGQSVETTAHVIPSGGDIVLGQEYTDFDKGLEEGIEGSVLGFNLILASSFTDLDARYQEEEEHDSFEDTPGSRYPDTTFFARAPIKIMAHDRSLNTAAFYVKRRIRDVSGTRYRESSKDTARKREVSPRILNQFERRKDVFEDIRGDPLGLQLVKLSYVRCEIGRGSPLIGGDLMLISWSRTPVKIFGGATVKNVNCDCGKFSAV